MARRARPCALALPLALALALLRGAAWIGARQPGRAASPLARRAAEDEDALLQEAKLAAEAAKLRLEAAKLKSEAESIRAAEAAKASAASSPDASMFAPGAPSPFGTTAPAAAPAAESAAAADPAAAPAPPPAVDLPLPPTGAATTEASDPDAAALVRSPALLKAAGILNMYRSANGAEAFDALLERACSELDKAEGGAVEVVCGEEAAWLKAGVPVAEAKAALQAAADLGTPVDSPVRELASNLPADKRDRAAALKLLIYDQEPDVAQAFDQLMSIRSEQLPEGANEASYVDPSLEMTPEDLKAYDFWKRNSMLPNEDMRLQEYLKRLKEYPLAKQSLDLAAADAELAKLGEALSPMETKLYGAVRKAQLRSRPKSETDPERVKVLALDINIAQIIGAIVVIAVLAFASANLVKSSISSNSMGGGDIPMYTLQNDKQGK